MTLRQPSILLRALVLGAQGVFYNLFCTPYYVLLFHYIDLCFAFSFILYDITKDLSPFRRVFGGRGRSYLVSAINKVQFLTLTSLLLQYTMHCRS